MLICTVLIITYFYAQDLEIRFLERCCFNEKIGNMSQLSCFPMFHKSPYPYKNEQDCKCMANLYYQSKQGSSFWVSVCSLTTCERDGIKYIYLVINFILGTVIYI